MNFKKLIETRFADPVTALDISSRYVCHGSAMGRIAFYDINYKKDIAFVDCQPELIRGVIGFTQKNTRSLTASMVTLFT